jgi:hypothetical protein
LLPPKKFGLSINAGTGVITGTVSTAGTSTVTVTVSDGKGGAIPTSFTWAVTSASTGGSFRYVKLEEVSGVSGKAFGSAAELNVLDTSGTTIWPDGLGSERGQRGDRELAASSGGQPHRR